MILYFLTYFEPFEVDGIMCRPIPYQDGWFLPVGWESVLNEKGIEFEIVEIVENNPTS